MAKKKTPTSNNNGLFSEFQTLSEVGKSRYFIDTGNLSLNYICSGQFITGGVPGGKIIEVYGPPSSSKSLLAMCCLSGCQKMGGIAVHLDCERAANPDFAEKAGHVNTKQLILFEPISIEDVEKKILMATRKIRSKMGPDCPILFTYDSIGVTPTEREWCETKLPETYTKEEFKKIVGGLEKPGERARAAGDMLRKINPFLDENNATLFVINQTRQAIGGNPQFNEITAGGGKALPFYASLRLRTSAFKNILDTNEVPIGVNLKFTNKKNRSFTPYMSCGNIHLYFSKGINPVGGLLTIMIQAGRIKKVSGQGRYQVEEPWADGQEVVFTATKVEDVIPLDVLYKCPKIIDAKTTKQVEDYLGVFAEAIQLSASGKTSEKNVDNDDEESAVDKLDLDLEAMEAMEAMEE